MLQMKTTSVSKCSIGKERLHFSMGESHGGGILEPLNRLLNRLVEHLRSSRFIFFQQDVWYDHRTGLLLPTFDSENCCFYSFEEFDRLSEGWQYEFAGFMGRPITEAECKAIFSGSTDHYPHVPGRRQPIFTIGGKEIAGNYLYTNLSFKAKELEDRGTVRSIFLTAVGKSYFALSDGTLVEKASSIKNVGVMQDKSAFLIPVCSLPLDDSISDKNMATACALLELQLLPLEEKGGAFIVEEEKFQEFASAYKKLKNCLVYKGNCLTIMEGSEPSLENIIPSPEELKEMFSTADVKRADIFPYPVEWITDREKGSWSLFEATKENSSESAETFFDEDWYARDPRQDIHRHGVCAIDFGTKSTVVACLDQEKRLLRIGRSNLDSAPKPKDYENPTAIELRNYIKKFMPAYESRHGRPFTCWEDVTVSYEAMNRLLETEDEAIAGSIFFELKEWALRKGKNRDKMLPLHDQKNSEVKLFPYATLDPSDFDPIEIYAYYLGLYINNQWNGIYLNYILSFPADAEISVKAHVLESFERGLRQSLPRSLCENEELMESFRIYEGASEPAAYAVCALRELAKDGELALEDGPIPFAVFDFGGGTTDFDYGVWRNPREDDRVGYNQVIEHISAESDPGLGGEKLLDLMAYEVYKANLEEMREKNILFVLPDGGHPFAGSELLLVENSLKALLNRRRLSAKLRPIWEEEEGWEHLGDDTLTIDFFDRAGMEQTVSLVVDLDCLRCLLKKRISRGVENFFWGLDHAFNEEKVCHILLAGNSSQSSMLHGIFFEYLKQRPHLKLHMPLGFSNFDGEADCTPTGKTGVVFGLLDARKGAGDVLVVDAEKGKGFPYHLGKSDGACFKLLIDRDANEGWQPFCEISNEDSFEIYFTSEPRARSGFMPIEDANRLSCSLVYHTGERGGTIYMRSIGQRLEYVVSTPEEIAKEKYRSEILTVDF